MNLYWPNLYAVAELSNVHRYSTYNACKTREEALKVIEGWISSLSENERPIISWVCVKYKKGSSKIIGKKEYYAQFTNGMDFHERKNFAEKHGFDCGIINKVEFLC